VPGAAGAGEPFPPEGELPVLIGRVPLGRFPTLVADDLVLPPPAAVVVVGPFTEPPGNTLDVVAPGARLSLEAPGCRDL
jgi:hypothetical protein